MIKIVTISYFRISLKSCITTKVIINLICDGNNDIFDKNTDIFDENTDIFDENTDMFDENTDIESY